ncbi:MAG: tetratricopeptide repeat protein [Alphaproteobacteria bacterium]
MAQDRFGLPVNCDQPAAVALYTEGLDLLLSANAGAAERLDAALAEAPDFALAHAARARLAQMYAQPAVAREHAGIARKQARGEREQGHVEAIALAVEGRAGDAMAQVARHARDFPRDALPLSLALGVYGLLGFSGRVDHHEAQRDLLESVAHGWDEDWWFLTYLGWSYAETFDPAKGAPLLDRALELNPRNAHAAHARAHAYYEAGEAAAGRDFVAAWLPDYDRDSQLHCHLTWHTALFALQLGDVDAALALYDDAIRPDVATSPPLFTLADAASLLWRLAAYGQTVDTAAWGPVAALAGNAFPHAGLPFADVHATMAAAAAGADVAARIAEIDALVAAGKLAAGPVVPALCRGLAAFDAGEPDRAVAILEPALSELARIGGSHAQRDVIEDTVIIGYLRAGQNQAAAEALERRTRHRAGHLDADWLGRIAV